MGWRDSIIQPLCIPPCECSFGGSALYLAPPPKKMSSRSTSQRTSESPSPFEDPTDASPSTASPSDSQDPLKRNRRSRPKVKTGCATCKYVRDSSHVKWDGCCPSQKETCQRPLGYADTTSTGRDGSSAMSKDQSVHNAQEVGGFAQVIQLRAEPLRNSKRFGLRLNLRSLMYHHFLQQYQDRSLQSKPMVSRRNLDDRLRLAVSKEFPLVYRLLPF
jgi:hypothetical protein